MRLSGGLDSSIVASCLAEEGTIEKITFFTYFSRGSNTDEREFGRLMAARVGRPLVERERDPTFRFERILSMAPTPSPTYYVDWLALGPADAALARSCGSTSIFTGAAGDQLFFQFPTVSPAADYARRHGGNGARPRVACFRSNFMTRLALSMVSH